MSAKDALALPNPEEGQRPTGGQVLVDPVGVQLGSELGARSSELGVEEPRRQAPKLIAEGEKFAKKAFRRYKNNVVFPDDASANMDAFAAFLSRQAANMDAFRWPDMDMRLPPCHASLAAGGGWTRVQGAPGQRLGVIAFFRSEGNDQRER